MAENSLADVLSDAPPAPQEPVAAVAPTPAPQEPAAATPAPVEQKPAAESKPAPAREELTAKERAFLARAQDETRKRQELERQINELRAQPKEPPKPFYEDPDGALQREHAARESLKQEIAQAFIANKLTTSEYHARKTYADYDEKMDEFARMIQEVPGIHQQCLASPDPADFAYTAAKNRIELREAGSIEQLRAKMEKEIRLKVEQELKQKADEQAKIRGAIPPSLGDVTGVSGQNKPVWNGPTPLGAIIAR